MAELREQKSEAIETVDHEGTHSEAAFVRYTDHENVYRP